MDSGVTRVTDARVHFMLTVSNGSLSEEHSTQRRHAHPQRRFLAAQVAGSFLAR